MISASDRGIRRLWRAARAAACLLLCASWANADDAEMRAVARDLAVQGAEAFERGDYDQALDRFERAAVLVEAPSISLMQARSLVAVGRWVEGLDKYYETARSQLAPDAPQAFRLAIADAAREAAELEVRMPHLEIRIGAGQGVPEGMTVMLDGKEVPEVLLNVPRPVDPGEHDVVATASEDRSVSERVVVLEAEHKLVSVPVFDQVVVQAPEPEPIPPSPVKREPQPPKERQLRDWATPVAFAVGGVGIAAATLSGMQAHDEQNQLEELCDPGCPPSAAETLSSYRTQRTLFYVSLGVGMAGLGAGAYLSLTDGNDSEAGVAIALTPAGARVEGRF